MAGVHSGWACFSKANTPATCGLDMDVPAIAWNNSPGTTPGSGNGELPARIWRPGAVTSGLMISGAIGLGPRELKSVMEGAYGQVPTCGATISAVAVPGLAAM